MSVEFDTPANRIIEQFKPQQFGIPINFPDIAFLVGISESVDNDKFLP